MSVRESFVAHFGEANADALREACLSHTVDDQNELADLISQMGVAFTGAPQGNVESNMGSDPFKYYVLAAIAFECVSRAPFRKHHGIDIEPLVFHKWVVQHAGLDDYDGDYPDQMSVALINIDPDLHTHADLLLRSITKHQGETA